MPDNSIDSPADFPIYVFAKAPVPGEVKTRLCPPLMPAQAAEVAIWLLEITLEKLVAHWPGRVVLTVSPDEKHPVFQRLIARFGVEVERQIDADLGARMQHVLEKGIAESGGAAVIGCDVPDLAEGEIKAAWKALQQEENAIAPTFDGGFYLLACRFFKSGWFAEVKWGDESVREQVVANAKALGDQFATLAIRHDLDVAVDLKRVTEKYPALAEMMQ